MSGIVNDQERKTLGILAALAIVALVLCMFRMASCQEHQDKVIAEMRSKQVEAKKEATP
jgi:hypothetical protein